MNDLEKFFNQNTSGTLFKWHHYFNIYDRHFSKYRGKNVSIVEFGVFQGGSLRMWKDYFGENCKIYGIDINEHCAKLTENQVEIFIGDQDDKEFLKSLIDKIPHIDILIDDGGHRMQQQINTFEILFDHIDENGVYLCEDLHTSYWKKYGGGYKNENSFIEYSKNFIDKINAWHSHSEDLKVSRFTETTYSLHYYDSIVVIEKAPITQPVFSKTGNDVIPIYKPPKLEQKDSSKKSTSSFQRLKPILSKIKKLIT